MTRRQWLAIVAVLGTACNVDDGSCRHRQLRETPPGANRGTQVQTDSGIVEGVALDKGIRVWLGMPFAAPPVRELRWRAPQPAPKWQGVFHADRAAPMCLQALRSRTMNHYFGNEGDQRGLPVPQHLVAAFGPAPAGHRVDLRRRLQCGVGQHGQLLRRGPGRRRRGAREHRLSRRDRWVSSRIRNSRANPATAARATTA